MPFIGPGTAIAYRQKRVTLAEPGAPVPDSDGGYTQGTVPLVPPALWARVRPATVRDLESTAGGTVISQATHLVSVPFHPGITTQTVLTVEDYPRPNRQFTVLYVGNPDERDASVELLCAEVVT